MLGRKSNLIEKSAGKSRVVFLITGIHRMPFDAFYVSILSSLHGNKSIFTGMWHGFISWMVALVNKEQCSSLIYIIK
tara:strand:- start:444 stop:674 length:231 start_codon:yes stop_codon:yes gene_type:complete